MRAHTQNKRPLAALHLVDPASDVIAVDRPVAKIQETGMGPFLCLSFLM